MYNILEAKIEWKNNQLHRITVLVEMSPGDIRAILATDKFRNGYMHLDPSAILDYHLLQEVAGYGMETVDIKENFPNYKKYFL